MAALPRFNRVKLTITAGGTGNLTVGSAVSGYNGAGDFGTNEFPYIIEWSAGYEIGMGALSGSTFTRSTILENGLGDDSYQSIPTTGTISIGQIYHGAVAFTGSGAAPSATGTNSIALGLGAASSVGSSVSLGSPSSAGDSATSIGSSANAAGVQSVAIGNGAGADADGSVSVRGYTNSTAIKSVSIGAETVSPNQIGLGFWPNDVHTYRLRCTTTNATATTAQDTDNPFGITIPDGQTWSVKTKVLGVAYNTGTLVETKAKLRTFNILAGPTGVLVAGTPVDELNHSTFTGTASIAVSAGGVLSVTVTGIAATTIDWHIQHDVLVAYHGA